MTRRLLPLLLVLSLSPPAPADDPKPPAERPPYERLLQGDDAQKVTELARQLGQELQANQYAKALVVVEEMVALRRRVQGDDHWQIHDIGHQQLALRIPCTPAPVRSTGITGPFDRALQDRDAVADLRHHFGAPRRKFLAWEVFRERALMNLRARCGADDPQRR